MFGWEFPPHISGGLGTACYGLTKGLTKHNTEVLFVVPKAYGDEDGEVAHILNASEESVELTAQNLREYSETLKYIEIDSLLAPYMDPLEYERVREETSRETRLENLHQFKTRFEFSGKYGASLMEEVARYAMVGASIAARLDFDVIHAHDWLTYQA